MLEPEDSTLTFVSECENHRFLYTHTRTHGTNQTGNECDEKEHAKAIESEVLLSFLPKHPIKPEKREEIQLPTHPR